MTSNEMVIFEPYRLDLGEARLWRGDEEVHLTAKAFAVLHYLVTHAGQLITRDTLFDEVWGTPYVTEEALAPCIREIRRALEDRAQQPRFVATVRGRGYRFVAPVVSQRATASPDERSEHLSPDVALPGLTTPLFVAREAELSQLERHFALARQGTRQVVLINGEAGIGKTALVDAFAQQLLSQQDGSIIYGQCVDQYGEGEPYLPLLEALGQLLQGRDGETVLEVLKRGAPSWLLQLPAFLSDAEFESVQRRSSGATRQRMLRELAEAVETLTANQPLVLVLEDLHWSDMSTLDWLTYIACRRQDARLLILGTYRPVDAVVSEHPVRRVVQELRAHGWCTELPLDYLTESGVSAYLTQRFHGEVLPNRMVSSLHQRTNGNPFFLVTLVDELAREGVLRQETTGWALPGDVQTLEMATPAGLQQLITQQLEQLSLEEQGLIEAASVAGKTFTIAALAAVVERQNEAVEESCAQLARQGRFVQADGTERWPDGTLTSRYRFIHDLYREITYGRVPMERLARWHRQIGLRMEAGYGANFREIATELARHFVSGRDTPRALTYLYDAGKHTLRRSAPEEAMVHFKQGLELLEALPESPEHRQQELAFLNALGQASIVAKGTKGHEVAHTYQRVRELSRQIREGPQLAQALVGLWGFYIGRASYQDAYEIAQQLYDLAQRAQGPVQLVAANQAMGITLYFRGRFTTSLQFLQDGCSRYRSHGRQPTAPRHWLETGVLNFSYAAVVLAIQGYPEQARVQYQEGLDLARASSHPFNLVLVLILGAITFQLRREGAIVQELAQAAVDLSTQHQFSDLEVVAIMLQGWALVELKHVEAGMVQMERDLDDCVEAVRSVSGRTQWLYLIAERYWKAGQLEYSLKIIDEALATVEKTGEHFFEAELYCLRGDVLLFQSANHQMASTACYTRAIDIAQSQHAKLWELRAATRLARLLLHQGRHQEARDQLVPAYSGFTEGFDTADLREAHALLQRLST